MMALKQTTIKLCYQMAFNSFKAASVMNRPRDSSGVSLVAQ
jgi:hypothetical protein